MLYGESQSCGCLRKEVAYQANAYNLLGQTFGDLRVVVKSRKCTKMGAYWTCLCDCKNEVDVSYNSLVYCNQISCGCKKKEHNKVLGGFIIHVDGTSIDALKSRKFPSIQPE